LTIAKSASIANPAAGVNYTYVMAITSTVGTSVGVILRDTLPTLFSFQGSSPAATVTNALVIFGMRMEKIMSDTDAKTFPFSINTNNAAITALFDCQTMTDFGITSGHSTGSNQIPFARDANGTVYYMNVYT